MGWERVQLDLHWFWFVARVHVCLFALFACAREERSSCAVKRERLDAWKLVHWEWNHKEGETQIRIFMCLCCTWTKVVERERTQRERERASACVMHRIGGLNVGPAKSSLCNDMATYKFEIFIRISDEIVQSIMGLWNFTIFIQCPSLLSEPLPICFSLFSSFQKLKEKHVLHKILSMTGFESWASGNLIDHSAN